MPGANATMSPDATQRGRPPSLTRTAPSRLRTVGALAAVAAVAALVRLANLVSLPDRLGFGDPEYYHLQAKLIARGHGLIDPYVWLRSGEEVAVATHPPAFPSLLAVPTLLGYDSVLAHRLAVAVVGVLTVLAIARIGHLVGGREVAVVASALAALYPNLWGLEGSLMSESLAVLLVAVALGLVVRLDHAPTTWRAASLGVIGAIAIMTRPETALLLALFVVWFVAPRWRTGGFQVGIVVIVTTTLLLSPLLVRNLTGFSRPVLISTNGDQVLAVTNCEATYEVPSFLGYWAYACNGNLDVEDDARRSSLERRRGLEYAAANMGRLVTAVVPARVGRVWDLYRPFENARYSADEGRHLGVAYAGTWTYWCLLALAAVGVRSLLRQSRRTLAILAAPALVVTATAIYAYGAVRFRAIAEPSLVVFAALGVTSVVRALRSSRQSSRAATAGSPE
jgi:4-amino-4-deoxy-L-arabinose transferase-like glycosyltransferase